MEAGMPGTPSVNPTGSNAGQSPDRTSPPQTLPSSPEITRGAPNWHKEAIVLDGAADSLHRQFSVSVAAQQNPQAELAKELHSAEAMEAFLETNPAGKIKTSFEGRGKNLVHITAQYGSVEALEVVLRHVANMPGAERKTILNARSTEMGTTPLMVAEASPRSFKAVLNVPGLDVNVKDWNGRSVLGRAAVDGNAENMKAVLEHAGEGNMRLDPNQKDNDGFTPLHSTVAKGHEGTFDLLAVDPRVDLNATDPSQRTPVHFAASKGHVRMLEKMYATQEREIDPRRKFDMDRPGPNGETPFMYAVIEQKLEAVKLFLDKGGINFNAQQTVQRLTPLALAGFGKRWEVFDLMMAHRNIDPNFQESGVHLLKMTMMVVNDPDPVARASLGDLSPLVQRLVDSDRITGDREPARQWLAQHSAPGIINFFRAWFPGT